MISLAFHYVRWHYSTALVDLVRIVRNFLWFFFEFFSITLLLKTFFTPFHRISDNRVLHGKLDIAGMAERLLVDLLMRFVGMLLRTVLILAGIVFIVATLVSGVAFFVAWIASPLLVFLLIASGITLISIG
jgi:hypothetical protein